MSAMKIGDSVRMYFVDGRHCFGSESVMGVVRKVSPRRIVVWTGTTGFGQKRWPFDQKGNPVGRTLDVFPELRIDLGYVDPFADGKDIRVFRSDDREDVLFYDLRHEGFDYD